MKYLYLFLCAALLLCVSCEQRHQDNSSLPSHIQRQKTDPTPEQIQSKKKLISKRKQQGLKKSNSGFLQNVIELGPNKDGVSLYGSFNFGASSFYSGMVKDIAIRRNDENTIVVATETSGAWLCIKNGAEFQCEPIDDDHAETRWETVVQHPGDDNIFFFGGTFDGLYYTDISTNNGLIQFVGNIDGVANESFDNVNVLKWDENDQSTFYIAAGLYDPDGTRTFNIYRFDYLTNSFINVSADLTTDTNSRFGEIEVLNDGSIIVCRKRHFYKLKNGSNGTGLLASYNTGWGQYMLLAGHDNIVYSMIYRLDQSIIRFYRSLDYGVNWNYVDLLNGWNSQAHDQALEVVDIGSGQHLFLSGTIDGFVALVDNSIVDNTDPIDLKSMNFGHKDFHGFEKTEDHIYAYNDGGLFRALKSDIINSIGNSGFANFNVESVNQNLPTLQANSIWYRQNSDEAVLGFWHNGAGAPNAGVFEVLSGGDGFDVAIAPGQDAIVYTTSQRGNIYRNGTEIHSGDTSVDPFYTQIFVDSSWPTRLYFVNPELGIKRVNNAHNCASCYWGYIFNGEIDLFTKTMTADDPHFYFTRQNGNQISFYRINSLNEPFSDVQSEVDLNISLTGNNVEQLDLFKHPDHPEGTLFILVKNENNGHSIYKIENANDDAITTTITEIATFSDFEDIVLNELFVTNCEGTQFLIGTEFGLYVSSDSGQTFQAELSIPAVEITDLVFKPNDNKLFISTYGRGGWMGNIQATECNNPFIVALPYSYTNCQSYGGTVFIPINLINDMTVISDPSGNINFNPDGTGYAFASDLIPGLYEFDINGEIYSFEIIDGCGICICPDDVTVVCNSDMLSLAVSLAIWAEPIKQCIDLGSSYILNTIVQDNVLTTTVEFDDCQSQFSITGDSNCEVLNILDNYFQWLDNQFPEQVECPIDSELLHDDVDKYIDGELFGSNPFTLKEDVSLPGTIIKNAKLRLFFRVFGSSCRSEIKIRVTDPVGNQFVYNNLFSDNNCITVGLHEVYVDLPYAFTTGQQGLTWQVEYADSNDQNAGDEFSVRYAGISYDRFEAKYSDEDCSGSSVVSEDCYGLAPDTIQLDSLKLEGEYLAREAIISNGYSINEAILKGGKMVNLKEGFEVQVGSQFTAVVDSCQ